MNCDLYSRSCPILMIPLSLRNILCSKHPSKVFKLVTFSEGDLPFSKSYLQTDKITDTHNFDSGSRSLSTDENYALIIEST